MRFALAALFAVGALPGQQSFQIVTDSLPAATPGAAYSQQLATSGGNCQGSGTATSIIDSGTLPPGLSVTSPAGARQWFIGGVPTVNGTFTFTLHIFFTLERRTPFVPICTDDAVKALTITVGTGGVEPPGPPGPPSSTLAADRSQVTSTYHLGHFPPPDQTVTLTAVGTPSATFTAAASTNSGGNWLSVSPPGGATPTTLNLSFAPTGLTQGVYTGKVTVSPASGTPLTISVTLNVILDSSVLLVANPTAFAFTSLNGAPAPASQALKVSISGDNVLFQADISAPPSGKWLVVNPAASATPAQLTVSVEPKTLTPGTYNGTITLRVPGVPNSAQVIPVTYTIQNTPVVPTISPNGIVNAAGYGTAIAPGTWVSIFGSALSTTTRGWRDTDFANGKLPLALDGVGVTINGKSAAVAFVSPTQINALAPDDPSTGLGFVQVKSSTGTSDNALVLQQTIAPAFFQLRAGAAAYVAGTHADNSLLAGTALVQQGILGTPAKPGETIVLYGTGFGVTQPPISAGVLVPAPLALANPQDLRIRIGGVDSSIVFAGLVAPGLYQFNVVVPQVTDGDQPLIAELRGLLTSSSLMVPIQH